jgi:general secretion pathway protein K
VTPAGGAFASPPIAAERPSPRRRGERGVALVIVLWTLALLAVLAGAFSTASRTHTKLAFNVIERAKAEALADAAVARAIAGLLTPPEEGGLRVDQTPYAWIFDGGEVVFTIADEGGKIDLNSVGAEELSAILAALGVPARDSARLAGAIVDFRDDDQAVSASGAEAAEYRRAGLPHGPKDAPFERVDELSLVLGMTSEVMALLGPIATVHTATAEPTIALMAPEYRAALQGVIGVSGAGDDAAVEGEPSAQERQGQFEEEPEGRQRSRSAETRMLSSLRPEGLDLRSEANIYTVHAEARSAQGAIFVREAVVAIEPDNVPAFRFLDIRQGSRQFLVDR